jgi:hypothetical protein
MSNQFQADGFGFRRRSPFQRCAAALTLTAFFFSAVSTPANASAMTLPGKAGVAPNGGLTYSIPIVAPPGAGGLMPQLSLSYNSQGGNGLLGVGWSIGGLPSITRCGQTVAQDGVLRGINHDADDRFCLDGERLVAVSGAYGADGTQYRTEVESYNKITSYGTQGYGPAWFEVRTKSGQVMQFGWSADSRILAVGTTTARVWAISKVSDTAGNYYRVSYTNDTTNGQHYPGWIDYTGNSTAGIDPPNRIQFVWDGRPDPIQHYQAGSLIRTNVRLVNVRTYAGSMVSDYRLAYYPSNATNRSRITSITVCDPGNSCLPATTFGWQDLPAPGHFTLQYSTSSADFGYPPNASWSIVHGDFNGDGKSDYAMVGGSSRWVYLCAGDGTFATVYSTFAESFGYPPGAGWEVVSGDFNGDGKTDYLMHGDAHRYVYLSIGDGNFTTQGHAHGSHFGTPPHTYYSVTGGDFNGDGRADYALLGSETRYVYLSNGDGTFSMVSSGTGGYFGYPPTNTWSLVEGDFNGDGKSDYALVGSEGRYVNLSNGDGTFNLIYTPSYSYFGYPPNATWTVLSGDFNGDGKTDYLMHGDTGRFVYLSLGNGSFTLQYSVHGANFGYPPHANWTPVSGDFNGDGKTDYALHGDAGRFVYMSSGDGNFTLAYSVHGSHFGSPPHANYSPIVGDFDGDGLTDYGMIGSSHRFLYRSNGTMPDLMTSITTGLGATTTVTYVPATNTSVVTKQPGTSYPIVDLAAPMYVVSRIDAPNGVGGVYSTAYAYAGGRLDTRGRGFLGFADVSARDLQTDVVDRTWYSQQFPYIGLATTSWKTRYTLTLNRVTNTYQFVNNVAGASVGSPSIPLAPYKVSTAQSEVYNADLDGTVMPTATTTYQYDTFGNSTQVLTTTSDGFAKTTTNTYTNDTSLWLLGRLTRSTVTSVSP